MEGCLPGALNVIVPLTVTCLRPIPSPGVSSTDQLAIGYLKEVTDVLVPGVGGCRKGGRLDAGEDISDELPPPASTAAVELSAFQILQVWQTLLFTE